MLLARSWEGRFGRAKWRENEHLAGSLVVVCKMHEPMLLVTELLSLAIPFHRLRVVLAIVLPVAGMHLAPLARTL